MLQRFYRLIEFAGILSMLLLPCAVWAQEETPRPVPPRGPHVRAMPVKPGTKLRVIHVQATFKLRDDKSTRTRALDFQDWRDTGRDKKVRMKHGAVWLNLTISVVPPGYIVLKGAFRAGTHYFPIQKKSWLLNRQKQTWDITFVHNTQDKKAGVEIALEARLRSHAARPKTSLYTFNVENLTLRRLMKRLAEFNNLRLSYSPTIKNITGITLKLRAKTRVALIHKVCNMYNIDCKILGTVLWVKAKP